MSSPQRPPHPSPRLPFSRLVAGLLAVAAIVTAVAIWRDAASDSSPRAATSPSASRVSPSPGRIPASAAAAPAPRLSPAPSCTQGDDVAPDADPDDWATTLLDTRFALAPTYVPPDLVSVERAGFEPDDADEDAEVRGFVIPSLAALRGAAQDAGVPVSVAAAYRSYVQQASLYERRSDQLGSAVAAEHVARPGHSEHQLGTTVDFKSKGAADVDQAWGSTPAGRWMQAHAASFGFVQSYPAGKTPVTCYAYEPWHFRYVGRDEAADVARSGLTLREYLWRHDRPSPGPGSG